MYQDLLIDEDQGWLCRWFQCHGRPTEMKTQKLLTWSYDDGFPIIRENSWSLSFKSFEYSCRGREDATSLERFGDSGWDPRSFGIWRNNLPETSRLKFLDWATGKLPWLPFLSCWRRKRNKQNHFNSKLRCFLIFLSKGAQDISSGHSTNKMPSSWAQLVCPCIPAPWWSG